MSKTTAIVLSGGSGTRMKSDIPKQYLELDGYPVLYYSLRAFQDSDVDDIIIVSSKEYIDKCNDIAICYGISKVSNVVCGGQERYESVYNGLLACQDTDMVLIHDGARPMISKDIIKRNLDELAHNSACVTGVLSKDTVKIADKDGFVMMTPERRYVWNIQTPQSFDYNLIMSSYEKMMQADTSERKGITDDAMVVELFSNRKIRFVEGEYSNIKITTPEDMVFASNFLKSRSERKI